MASAEHIPLDTQHRESTANAPDLAPFSQHGGALDVARRIFPQAPEPWIDLSTGINPVPYPIGAFDPASMARLPEAKALNALEHTAAARYGAPPAFEAVAAPGTQAIIQRLPDLYGADGVRVLGRTYGEYARVFATAGRPVHAVTDVAHLAGAAVAILVNPNNPDGRLVAPSVLRELARDVGVLIVDEAFMDALAPEASFLSCAAGAEAVVLRSFGKIYGLAGLRLGFALAPPPVSTRLRERLGPWRVSGPAIDIGLQALGDTIWLAETRRRLDSDMRRLNQLLAEVSATVIGSTPLFSLIAHRSAPALFRHLARNAILVRPFDDEPSWLRFGLPGDTGHWRRLESALRSFR